MNVIFSVIGTPSEEDLEFITDEKALEYIKLFPKSKGVDLKGIFPAITEEA